MSYEEDLLDQSLSLFGPGGVRWGKGPDVSDAKRCIYTAMGEATKNMLPRHDPNWRHVQEAGNTALEMIRTVIIEQFPDRVNNNSLRDKVIMFNDHERTSFPEVRAVFQKTRARLEESTP